MLFGGKLGQFKGYSPSCGKVEDLLRHNGRRKQPVVELRAANCSITKDADEHGQFDMHTLINAYN